MQQRLPRTRGSPQDSRRHRNAKLSDVPYCTRTRCETYFLEEGVVHGERILRAQQGTIIRGISSHRLQAFHRTRKIRRGTTDEQLYRSPKATESPTYMRDHFMEPL